MFNLSVFALVSKFFEGSCIIIFKISIIKAYEIVFFGFGGENDFLKRYFFMYSFITTHAVLQ